MSYLFSFIVSMVISMLLVPPLIRLAPLIGAIDLPDPRKVHARVIPRIGGIAMIVGVMVPVLFSLPFNQTNISLLVSFSILLFFGVWDDRANLNYRIKFLGQIAAVLIAVLGAGIVVRHLPFIESPLPDYVAIPFTVFALVGITNAINLSDGLDGLAGGTTLLTLCMMAFLAFRAGAEDLVILCMAVSGAIMGFLRHNTYPARTFMGDTGSQFLGFSAGVLVIMLSQSANRALSPVVPLLLLGLPILDTIAVMSQRIYEKRSPFSPDKNHVHHKLLAMGFDHYEAVLVIYVVQTVFVATAFLLRYENDAVILLFYLFFSGFALYLFHHAISTGWRVNRESNRDSALKRWVVWQRSVGLMEKIPIRVLKAGIPFFIICAALVPAQIQPDIAILSAVLLFVWLFLLSWRSVVGVMEKAIVYVICVLGVYLLESNISVISEYAELINVYFVVLGMAFILKVRFSSDRTFQITPLDFLVVLLVLLVPNIPDFSVMNMPLGEAAFKLIVLFYASEAVLNVMEKRRDVYRLGMLAGLLLIAVRGIV